MQSSNYTKSMFVFFFKTMKENKLSELSKEIYVISLSLKVLNHPKIPLWLPQQYYQYYFTSF